MNVPTSEVLNLAADLIEEHGWAQGSPGMYDDHPQLCIQGAILAAMGEVQRNGHPRANECPAGVAVRDYLGIARPWCDGRGVNALWWWNDDGARTQAQVIETLRAVALIEAARENASAPVAVAVSA